LRCNDSGGRNIYTIKDKATIIRNITTPREPPKMSRGSNGEKIKITNVMIIADKNEMTSPRNNLINLIIKFNLSCW